MLCCHLDFRIDHCQNYVIYSSPASESSRSKYLLPPVTVIFYQITKWRHVYVQDQIDGVAYPSYFQFQRVLMMVYFNYIFVVLSVFLYSKQDTTFWKLNLFLRNCILFWNTRQWTKFRNPAIPTPSFVKYWYAPKQ